MRRIFPLGMLAVCCSLRCALAAPLTDLEPAPPVPTETAGESTESADLFLENNPLPKSEAETTKQTLQDAARSLARDDIEGCLALLKKAASLSPQLPAPQVMLAEFYLRAGNLNEARKSLQSIDQTDNHPQFHLTSAKVAFAEGRFEEANNHFAALASVAPPLGWTPDQVQEIREASYDGLASVAEARQQWQVAATHLERWLRLEPDDAGLRQRLGRVLLLAGNEAQARAHFEALHRQDETFNRPDVSVAAIYLQNGHTEKANSILSVALAE